jgi:dihydrolipoamide dehydrogenase
MEKFNYIIIGGGMAGMPIANKLAYKGYKTAVIEKDLLGGTCLNRGCVPTKTMLHSAKVAQLVREAKKFGIIVDTPKVDLEAIVKRKDNLVNKIRAGAYKQVEKNKNLSLFEGEAKFVSKNIISVNNIEIEAEKIVINTGAIPHIPKISGIESINYLTNDELLNLKVLPKSLAILGGGYIAVEFAQMFSRFGTDVHIFQRSNRLINREDPELSDELLKAFETENISVHLNSNTTNLKQLDNGIELTYIQNDKKNSLDVSQLLVATGRVSSAKFLDLDKTDIKLDNRGFIKTDESYKTSQSNVWAVGDVTGNPMFTHSARDESEQLYQAITKEKKIKKKVIPYAIFTDPEIASVGLTEKEAIEKGYTIKIGKHPFSRVARALAIGKPSGFIKIIANEENDRILGAQIIGESAGELIHEFIIAINNNIKFNNIAESIHIHPTLSEGVNSAAGGVHKPAGN